MYLTRNLGDYVTVVVIAQHDFTYQRCSWQEPSLLRRGGCEVYEHVHSSLGLGWVILSL